MLVPLTLDSQTVWMETSDKYHNIIPIFELDVANRMLTGNGEGDFLLKKILNVINVISDWVDKV